MYFLFVVEEVQRKLMTPSQEKKLTIIIYLYIEYCIHTTIFKTKLSIAIKVHETRRGSKPHRMINHERLWSENNWKIFQTRFEALNGLYKLRRGEKKY